MKPPHRQAVVLPAILVFAAGVFVADLFTPLGVIDYIWYVLLLLLSLYAGIPRLPFLLAGIFSILTAAGYFFSPAGVDPRLALVSRCMGIIVLWLMAVLLSRRHRVEAARVRAFQQLSETNEALAALNKVTANAISTLELDDLLNTLLQRLLEVMKADAALLLLNENGRLVARASIGIDAAVKSHYSVAIGEGYAGAIAQSLKPLYVADAHGDGRVENPFVKQRAFEQYWGRR